MTDDQHGRDTGAVLHHPEQPLRCHRYPLDETLVAFTWTPSGQRRVYAAIFDQQPTRTDTAVSPPPIWVWMTGQTRSDVGRLHWDDGVLPDDRALPVWTSASVTVIEVGFGGITWRSARAW